MTTTVPTDSSGTSTSTSPVHRLSWPPGLRLRRSWPRPDYLGIGLDTAWTSAVPALGERPQRRCYVTLSGTLTTGHKSASLRASPSSR